MRAIRVKQKVASETLHVPELRALVGQQVEILILLEEPAPSAGARLTANDSNHSLRGSVRRYDDPFEAAVPAADWEANR